MANISQIKLPGITNPYNIEDTTARNSISNKTLASLSDVNLSANPVTGQVLAYDAETGKWSNNNVQSYVFSMTLAAGETQLQLSLTIISDTTLLDIYTDKPNFDYDSITISNHTATITFSKASSTNTAVRVKVIN